MRVEHQKSGRLLSVDVLRGLTIAFMILVNDPGEERVSFHALRHADWNGFTPTDLVFPTFLFLVGLSMVFSYGRREAAGAGRGDFLVHALRRAALLFAIGVVLNGFPLFPWRTLRIYGVLQRIALCFGAGSVLLAVTRNNKRRVAVFAGVFVACLLGYWALMRWAPVPGYGHTAAFLDKDANPVAWLDRKLLPGRLYEHTRDPEGLLSTIPAVGTLILGMLIGLWLQTGRPAFAKLRGLAVAGASLLLAGGLWNIVFPINKKLWTSSYVLWAGGWSLVLLAFFYWLCEVRGVRGRGWMPLLVFGRNAITSYVLAEVLAALLFVIRAHGRPVARVIYTSLFGSSSAWTSFAYALAFVLVCWVPMALLYRRGIFLKL